MNDDTRHELNLLAIELRRGRITDTRAREIAHHLACIAIDDDVFAYISHEMHHEQSTVAPTVDISHLAFLNISSISRRM